MDITKTYILSLVFLINGEASGEDNKKAKLPENCGTTRFARIGARIINGEEADLGQVPWMARIGRTNRRTGEPFFLCGGSIINSYYVISAAHCKESYFDMVRLGENYIGTDIDCDKSGICAPPPQDIRIRRIVDPNFCDSSMENDIILIELREAIKFNDFVQPICLPNNTFTRDELEATLLMISGWGLITSDPIVSTQFLMYIHAPLLNNSKCNEIYTTVFADTQLCIGYDKGKDSCSGDSGGPVMKFVKDEDGIYRSYLIGIVSYGLRRCGSGPAVYTDVNSYIKWIRDVMNGAIVG